MKVHIILGSKSDMPVAEKAKTIFDDFQVKYIIDVASAHRTPDVLKNIVCAKRLAQLFALYDDHGADYSTKT